MKRKKAQREWHQQDGEIGGPLSYAPTETIIGQSATDKSVFVGALRIRREGLWNPREESEDLPTNITQIKRTY